MHRGLLNAGCRKGSPRSPARMGMDLLDRYLAEKSGGDREQAVACALFQLIGSRFRLYDRVKRAATTAADTATGQVADLECLSGDDIVLAVEVKDQQLTVGQLQATVDSARAKQVSEILFVAQKGIAVADEAAIPPKIEEQFSGGQNVYVLDLRSLAKVTLAIMGEQARPQLLRLVAQQLEQFASEFRHRQAWSDVLDSA